MDLKRMTTLKVLLIVSQTLSLTSYVLLVQYMAWSSEGNGIYLSSTVVTMTEVWKLCFSGTVLLIKHQSSPKCASQIFLSCYQQPANMFKVSCICSLYAVQNNLAFIAIANTDSATYQVTSQLKIVSTAVMTKLIFKRHFTPRHWVAIFILFVGVSLVQLERSETVIDEKDWRSWNPSYLLGISATLLITLISGVAGVCFEKVVKSRDTDFWLCNFQMHFCGLVMSLIFCLVFDLRAIIESGFFTGYTPTVFLISLLSAICGILVSLVIGHLDCITKTFAVAGSVVLSVLGSMYLFHIIIGLKFVVGTVLVCAAAYMYNFTKVQGKRSIKSSEEII